MYATQRGDVYFADLNPVVGSEQGGKVRPVVIIQNDVGNKHSETLIIASVTARKKPVLPIHVELNGIDFMKTGSIVLLEQIRTIDRIRLKEYIGCLDKESMQKIDLALAISVGLNKDYCR